MRRMHGDRMCFMSGYRGDACRHRITQYETAPVHAMKAGKDLFSALRYVWAT
ncbi:hypothetical protein D9M73_74580 [compost metagenome]